MRRHPSYVIFMSLMFMLLLTGLALLIWGSTQQGPLPRPSLTVLRQVHHG